MVQTYTLLVEVVEEKMALVELVVMVVVAVVVLMVKMELLIQEVVQVAV